MAKKHKLYFRISKQGVTGEQIKEALRAAGLNVPRVSLYSNRITGVLTFQKKADRDVAQHTGSVDFEGVRLEFTGTNPPGSPPPQRVTGCQRPTPRPSNPGPEAVPQTASKFFNPYHFVNIEGFTPRYNIIPHDRFSHNCGKITATLEFATPGFIPDPEKTIYIISDETLSRGDDTEDRPHIIQPTIENWLKGNSMEHRSFPMEILFDPDCPSWKPENPGQFIRAAGEEGGKKGFQKGRICTDQYGYYLETRESNRWAHKVMEFFQVNGKYTIPSTSLKGMLRSTVETLSNSCFSGVEDEEKADYMFHRLDVQADNLELRGLKPVLLRKRDDGTWGYVMLDQARVLSPHLFNRIGASGENALGAYWNLSGCYYEKLSVVGKKDSDPDKCSGLHAYELPGKKGKNYRGEIQEISSKAEIKTNGFAVSEIKGDTLGHAKNQYNKTFPYVGSVSPKGQLWAIIRQLEIPKKHGKGFFLSYTLKLIADRKKTLEGPLKNFDKNKKYEKNAKHVKYAICEIRIKTAFDIDTKTQHRAFFLFGKEEFDKAVEQSHVQGFGRDEKTIIARFCSLLRQRKEHAKKLSGDINRAIATDMPDDIHDGMLAYYHPTEKYLTYTTVPQKPYRWGPREILEQMDKLPCDRLDRLCPACQMFGTVIGKKPRDNGSVRRASGFRGKVTVSQGTLKCEISTPIQPVTLKPLSTPKPTFSPFYILNNRKTGGNTGRSLGYDDSDLKVGRKIYLHHPEERLNYATDSLTNLNATVYPLPSGTRFSFTVDFENLTNYELGLLLYSLEMQYGGEKAGYHLGMGKSLGLGSCTITIEEVTLYDMPARYRSLEEDGRTDCSADEIERFEMGYKHVQGVEDIDTFLERQTEVNEKQDMGNIRLPPDNQIEAAYFSRPYIRDFHILKSFNVHPEIKSDLPVHFAGGMKTEGFKWYQRARGNQNQRLFEPIDLEADAGAGNDLRRHALTP